MHRHGLVTVLKLTAWIDKDLECRTQRAYGSGLKGFEV